MYSRTKGVSYFTGNAMQTAYNSRNPWIVPNTVVQTGTDAQGKPVYEDNTTPLNASNIYNSGTMVVWKWAQAILSTNRILSCVP